MTDRTPTLPPVIAPVEPGQVRPLWSVMIPTYNCIEYVKEAIESVLLQDPGVGAMQVEVIDDHSADGDVGALVENIGKGRVGYFRQEVNRGSLRNFETCLNRSKGEYIHILHGDDRIKQGFYKEIESLFRAYPQIGAAFTKYTHIDERGVELEPGRDTLLDEPGVLEGFLFKVAMFQQLQPPSIVVKRKVYEQLGGFFGVHYGEDWEMWIRIASRFDFAYSPKCLALYRVGHQSNITTRTLQTGQNIKDISRVIDIAQNYLPENKRAFIKNRARKNFSIHYAMASNRMYDDDKRLAFVQAKGALQLHVNIKTVYWILKLCAKHMSRLVRNAFRIF